MKQLKNRILKFICVCLAAVFASVMYTAAAGETEQQSDNTELTVSSSKLQLSVNTETGALKVLNLESGEAWMSSPAGAEEDPLASGITRTNLLSCLVLCYKNGNSLAYTNDYTGSVLRGNAEFRKENGVITAIYGFADQEFVIPVEYSVNGSCFSASIIAKDIDEGSKYQLKSIDLLPFFGAGGTEDSGYMLIPDGSGAVIEFNNGKSEQDQYNKSVYGEDLSLKNEEYELNGENILLGAFGIKKNSGAFVAEICDGAARAELCAAVSGQSCSYNRAYASFLYRDMKNLQTTKENVSGMFSSLNTSSSEKFSIRYTFLSGENAGISGMAQTVREQLKSEGMGSENKNRLVLDFYGGVEKEKALLGIRYTGTERLTSYGGVLDILSECRENGIKNIDSSLRNFTPDEISVKVSTGFKHTSKLGKKSDYKELISNESVYPYININRFYKSSFSYNRFFTSALGLDLVAVELYDISIQDRAADELSDPSYLVPYTKLKKAVSAVEKSIEKQKIGGICVDNLVNTLYSDFSKKGILRDGAEKKVCEILDNLGEIKLMMSAPNAYAFKYADVITDLPITSSGYAIFDYDVPFIQMLLHGNVDYTCTAVNTDAMSRGKLLNLIKTGSQLHFAVIENGGKSITGTELDYLNAAEFDKIKDIIFEWYDELSAVTEKIGSAEMVGYSEINGVSVTEYGNGINIFVNTTEQDLEANGITVPAMSYTVAGK